MASFANIGVPPSVPLLVGAPNNILTYAQNKHYVNNKLFEKVFKTRYFNMSGSRPFVGNSLFP